LVGCGGGVEDGTGGGRIELFVGCHLVGEAIDVMGELEVSMLCGGGLLLILKNRW
jgi:hypothetical protein